jgi:hypothetical protein
MTANSCRAESIVIKDHVDDVEMKTVLLSGNGYGPTKTVAITAETVISEAILFSDNDDTVRIVGDGDVDSGRNCVSDKEFMMSRDNDDDHISIGPV